MTGNAQRSESALRCPRCGAAVHLDSAGWYCGGACSAHLAKIGGVTLAMSDSRGFLCSVQAELAAINRLGAARMEYLSALAIEARLVPTGIKRLHEQAQATCRQGAMLKELLGCDLGARETDAFSQVTPGWGLGELVPWLIRDWGPVSELKQIEARLETACAAHLPDPASCRIAFPGCGAGGLAARLSAPFGEAFAFDTSLPVLAILARLLHQGSLDLCLAPPLTEAGQLALRGAEARHLEILAMDATRTAFADGALDGVLTAFLLDLLPDPHRLVAEVSRILAPGGIWINYGPSGPRGALWHFGGAETAELATQHGFSILESEPHRSTLFDFRASDPAGAWSSHVCHLLVASKTSKIPKRAATRPKGDTQAASIPVHFPGALIERRQRPGEGESILFAHERMPGRPVRFAIGPGSAAALASVDGHTPVAVLAARLVQSGLARDQTDAEAAYWRLIDAELLQLKTGSDVDAGFGK